MTTWVRRIEEAESVSEVVEITRDYMATWTPDDLVRLPQSCRPGRIKSESDLEELHDNLVDVYRSNRLAGEDLAALQRITSFVVRATVRAASLHTPGTTGS